MSAERRRSASADVAQRLPLLVGDHMAHPRLSSCRPNRLYWAGRPAIRFVQALHWLRGGSRPTTGASASVLFPFSRTPIVGWPFRTICVRTVSHAGVDPGNFARPAPEG